MIQNGLRDCYGEINKLKSIKNKNEYKHRDGNQNLCVSHRRKSKIHHELKDCLNMKRPLILETLISASPVLLITHSP